MDSATRSRGQAPTKSVLAACVLLLATCLAAGCGGSDSTGPADIEPAGGMVSMAGCKTWSTYFGRGTPPDQDCIHYTYARRTLRLTHVNTALNCCPEFQASVRVSSDSIFITEEEAEGGCRCLCLYDLTYEIRHLPRGTYRVIVAQEYLQPADPPLEFTIDLREAPSGSYCVRRLHYPWGEKSQG